MTFNYLAIALILNLLRRHDMKKIILLLSAVFMVASLSACASMDGGDEVKVKCPACGHEFNTGDTGR